VVHFDPTRGGTLWVTADRLHVGPVIAGVVGRRKYQYDVWGDTVNTAARLEQAAPPGSLCVESVLWSRLSERYDGQALGLVPLKGKGARELFRIDGVRTG
jgi:adenylate cyclase